MQKVLLILLFLLISIFIGCSDRESNDKHLANDTVELTVAAAASLTDALEKIKIEYEKNHDVDVTFTFLGSGKLAQQIEYGAPVDLFFSADETWMDYLEGKHLIDSSSKKIVVQNRLVLIANEATNLTYESFDDLQADDVSTIAIGHPDSVPAGKYAKEALNNIGVWEEISKKLVFAQDVRQVLTYVVTGNADVGIVYYTDIDLDGIKIIAEIDPKLHAAISYPAAVVSTTKEKEHASALLEFLHTEEAQSIFQAYGFRIPD